MIINLGILRIPCRLYLSSGSLMCFYVIWTKLVVDEVTEEGNFLIVLNYSSFSHDIPSQSFCTKSPIPPIDFPFVCNQ